MPVLFKNNLIAITVHFCLCVILLYPVNFMWWGSVWVDRKIEIKEMAINGLIIAFYTIIVLFLYFLSGKKFLSSTNNMSSNAFSVTVLFIILAIITLIAFDGTAERLLRIPYYPLGGTIAYFFQIKEKYAYLIMSVLPSLIMWIGMITKRSS